MNTQTINKICEKDFFISKYYIGCFACDQLPNTYPENALAVVNLDRIKDFGSHWVVVSSLDKNRTLYLDSFGRPLNNAYIAASLKNRKKPIFHNKIVLQHPLSQYCGFFCIFFCYFLARNYSIEEILKTYFNPPKSIYSDLLVKNFIKEIFSLKNIPPFLHLNNLKKKIVKKYKNGRRK